jgi:uncharacterized protein YcbK (DUF882 family)
VRPFPATLDCSKAATAWRRGASRLVNRERTHSVASVDFDRNESDRPDQAGGVVRYEWRASAVRIRLGRRAATAAGAACALILAGTASLQTADANGDTRTLSFVHTHTQERVTFTFKRNGSYDQEGLRQANQFLRDWRRNEQIAIDPRLLDLVWEVYRDVGGTQPIHLVSAYRSPNTNNMLRARSSGVARESQHTRGKAMDFFIPGVSVQTVRERGVVRQRGGVGFYPGSEGGFVHLDVGRVRAWPRLSREHLARLFPNGGTAHLPADGRPLPGYETAVARLGNGAGARSVLAYADANEDAPSPSGPNIFTRLFGGGGGEGETPTPGSRERRPAAAPVVTAAVAPRATERPERAAERPPERAERTAEPAAPARPIPLPPSRPAIVPEPAEAEAETIVAARSLPIPLPPERPVLVASAEATVPVASDTPAAVPVPAERPTVLASVDAGAVRAGFLPLPPERPRGAQADDGYVLASATPTGSIRPAPPQPAIQLVALDLSMPAIRPFVTAVPMRQRSMIRAAVADTPGVIAAAPEPHTSGFGQWRTRRTDSFAGPAVRNLMARL